VTVTDTTGCSIGLEAAHVDRYRVSVYRRSSTPALLDIERQHFERRQLETDVVAASNTIGSRLDPTPTGSAE